MGKNYQPGADKQPRDRWRATASAYALARHAKLARKGDAAQHSHVRAVSVDVLECRLLADSVEEVREPNEAGLAFKGYQPF
jgi:hypothetical protein